MSRSHTEHMIQKRWLVTGILLGLFVAGFSIVSGSDLILTNGFELSVSDHASNYEKLTIYDLKFNSYRENKYFQAEEPMIKWRNQFYFQNNDSSISYYPTKDPNDVPKKYQQITRMDAGEERYELLLVYHEDGKIDFSQSMIGVVRPENMRGRSRGTYQVIVGYENPDDPASYTVNESGKKIYHSAPIYEEREIITDQICYYTESYPNTQTGLCDYYSVASFSSLEKVADEDIPGIRAKIKRYNASLELHESELEKNLPPAPLDESSKNAKEVAIVTSASAPAESVVIDSIQEVKIAGGEVVAPIDSEQKSDLNTLTKNELYRLPTKNSRLFSPISSLSLQSTTTLFSEGFEGAWPGPWNLWDNLTNSDSDYWGDNLSQSYQGSWSGWAADAGDQITNEIIDTFNISLFPNWNSNAAPSSVHWGLSGNHPYSSPSSAYVAGSLGYAANQYTNNMNSIMLYTPTINAAGATKVEVEYRAWANTYNSADFLQFNFSPNNGGQWYYFPGQNTFGNTGGWITKIHQITNPADLTSNLKIRFLFQSDASNTAEGAYVDDLKIRVYKNNTVVGTYDNDMQAIMESPTINLSSYLNPNLSFWLKSSAESNDNFKIKLSSNGGSSWSTLDTVITTPATAWQQKSYSLSNWQNQNIKLRFEFNSDNANHNYFGAYVDEVLVTGQNLLSNGSLCTSPSQCISGVCGGANTTYSLSCSFNGSSSVLYTQSNYVNTCGGSGTFSSSSNGSTSCGGSQICDNYYAPISTTLNVSLICRDPIYSLCSTQSTCWNDNSGVDCMGDPLINKACTYGNNNDQCNINLAGDDDLKCDSGRCDANQCLSKLPNGSACNEASDCTANACTGGFCGTGLPVGSNCSNDSDCSSNYCSFTLSSGQATCAAASSNPSYTIFDSWDSSNSGGNSVDTDHLAFVNETVKPSIVNLKQNTDMLCYDFDSDGTYDACYYDTVNGCNGGSCSATSCNYDPIPANVPANKKWGCDIDSFNGCMIGNASIPAQICSGASCSVSTSTPKTDEMTVKAFYDCDNSSNAQSIQTIPTPNGSENDYAIISPKYFSCSEDTLPDPGYVVKGKTGNLTTQTASGINFSCPANQSCSIALDDQPSTSGSATLANVCKKNVGQSCSNNSECLYNICSSNVCQQGMLLDGSLRDQAFAPMNNVTVKLYTCSDSLVATTTTNSLGKYHFSLPTGGSYRTKFTTSWGEYVVTPTGSNSSCVSYPAGMNAWNWWMNTSTTVTGTALTPGGSPSVGLNFSLNTCSNSQLDSDSTNSLGQFSLSGPAGYQKLKVSIGANWFDVAAPNGNACILNYGNVDYGQLELTNNCSLYNNTCLNENTRLHSCAANATTGCGCAAQQCVAGCTETAPECNSIGTGTIRVTATKNNDPIVNASVFINDQSVGKTNGFGKKEVARPYGNYNVKVVCPGSSGIQSQSSVYLNGNSKHVTLSPNCPTLQKGDLKVIVNDINGLPVTNVFVFMDDRDSYSAITNLFGVAVVPALDYETHTLRLVYRLDVNSSPIQFTRTVDINAANNSIIHTLLVPGQSGYASYITTELSPEATILTGVVIGTVVLAALNSTTDYCDCVRQYSDVSIYNECLSSAANMTATNYTTNLQYGSTFRSFQINHPELNDRCGNPFIGTIRETAIIPIGDGAFRVVAKGAGAVGGAGIAAYRAVDDVIPISNTISSAINFAKEIKLVRYTSDGVEYLYGGVRNVFSFADEVLFGKPATFSTIPKLTIGGRQVARRLAAELGENGVVKLEQFSNSSDFHRTHVSRALNSLDKLQNNPKITAQALESIENKLKGDILTYQPGANSDFSKGVVGEAIGAFERPPVLANKIINSHDVVPPGVPTNAAQSGNTVDFIFTDGELYEIKTRVVSQPNGFGGDEGLILEDIFPKLDKWLLANPNQTVHIKFTNYISPTSQGEFITLVTTKNGSRQNPLNLSNVHFYWDASP